MDEQFRTDFASPSSQYRGKPFWAWNGKLDQEELRRQIRVFNQMGLGGFFMHSRVGLDTEYLGKEWFECVRACIDEAKKLGMEAWMYDEDRWPSGAAGGRVTKNPKYRMRSILRTEYDKAADFEWSDDTLAAYVANVDKYTVSNVHQLEVDGKVPELADGQKIIKISVKVQDPTPWHNDYTYLDTMNHDAVRQFIRVTHKAYGKEIKGDLGKTVPGIFTDEPNYCHGGPDEFPWTDKLPVYFEKRYGYDICSHLIEIFYDLDGQELSKARYHYYDCATFLFVDAFSRQIGEWCDAHKVESTGHCLGEETLSSQTNVVGSAMRFYEFMQAPGIDMLTERWRQYNTAKQCSSIARQFGRKWRLTETNGCTGWDWSFESHKAIGDWQAVNGINLRCPHLSFYTMLAEAKRDYPASISYQSPWWELYDVVEGYFARVHVAMMQGDEVRDLLVIHPIESMWTKRRLGWHHEDEVHAMDQTFDDIATTFLSEHIDFDYGDEEIMSRVAKVKKNNGSPVLKVGKAAYKAVVVPPMKTMRSSTLLLLQKFAKAGGKVVFTEEVAGHVDAEPSAAVQDFAATCTTVGAVGKELADAVASECRRLSFTDGEGNNLREVIYLLREDDKAYYLYVVNTSHVPDRWDHDPLVRDRKASYEDVRIRGFEDCEGAPIELNPSTGIVFAAEAEKNDDEWEIRTSLPRVASRIFLIPKNKLNVKLAKSHNYHDVRVDQLQPEAWDYTMSEANPLVLDRPRYRIGDDEWQDKMEILKIDSAVRDAIGIRHRGGAMVQPWARPKVKDPKRINVELSYDFDVEVLPSGEFHLGIERPETFEIWLNGKQITTMGEDGWWVDKSLRRIPVDPSFLKLGRNELYLKCDFDETHSGLEIVYLLGNFGTKVDGTDVAITGLPSKLRLGDWCDQGLTFYAGSLSYRLNITPNFDENQRLFVRLGEFRGVAVRVLVNGKSAGIIAWEPRELDITDAVKEAGGGDFELGIEIIGHCRNSHGPHHNVEKWPHWTGPLQFVDYGERWFEGYQLVPVGLMETPELVVRG